MKNNNIAPIRVICWRLIWLIPVYISGALLILFLFIYGSKHGAKEVYNDLKLW